MVCSRPDLYARLGGNTLYFPVGYKSLLSEVVVPRIQTEKTKNLEAVSWPQSITRKPRTDARFIANALLFSVVGNARRAAFVLALKHPSGTKFVNFPQVQRFLDKSHRFVDLLLQSFQFTGYDSVALELSPCFSVFAFQIFKRFWISFRFALYLAWTSLIHLSHGQIFIGDEEFVILVTFEPKKRSRLFVSLRS